MQVSARPIYPLGDVDDNGSFDAADMAVVDAVYLGAPLPPGVPLARLTPEPTLTLSWVNYLHAVLGGTAVQQYAANPPPATPAANLTTAWRLTAPGQYDCYLWCEAPALVLLHGYVTPTRVALYAADYTTLLEEHLNDYWLPAALSLFDQKVAPDWHCQLAAPAGWSLVRVVAASVPQVSLQLVGPFITAASDTASLAVAETRSWLLPYSSDFTLNLPGPTADYAIAVQGLFRAVTTLQFGEGAVLPDCTLAPQVSYPQLVEDAYLQPLVQDYQSSLAGLGTPAPATAPPTDAYADRVANTWWSIYTAPEARTFRAFDVFQSPSQTIGLPPYDSLLVGHEALHDPFPITADIEAVLQPEWDAWRLANQRDDTLEVYLYSQSKSALFATVDLGAVWQQRVRLALNVGWLLQRPTATHAELLRTTMAWAAWLSRWVEATGTNPGLYAPPLGFERGAALLYPDLNTAPQLLAFELEAARHCWLYPWLGYNTRNFNQLALAIERYGTYLQALFDDTLDAVLWQPTITVTMAANRLALLSDAVIPSLVSLLLNAATEWGYVPRTTTTDPIAVQRATIPLDTADLCTQVTTQTTTYITTEHAKRYYTSSTAMFSPLTDLYATQSLPGEFAANVWLVDALAAKTTDDRRALLATLTGAASPLWAIQQVLGGTLLTALRDINSDIALHRFPTWHAGSVFVTNYETASDRLQRDIYYVSTPDHGVTLLTLLQAWPDVALTPAALPYARIELSGTATLPNFVPAYSSYAPHPLPGVPEHCLPAGAAALFSKTQTGTPAALRLTADQAVLLVVTRTQ